MAEKANDHFEKKLKELFQAEFDLAFDIDALCHSLRNALKDRHQYDDDPGSLPHNILFVRAWRLWQALTRLAGQGYATEAQILARSIWETRIHLGYLCCSLEKRTLQFRRYLDLFREATFAMMARDRPESLNGFQFQRPDTAKVAAEIRDYTAAYGDDTIKRRLAKKTMSDFDVIALFLRLPNWMLQRLRSAAESLGALSEYQVFYPPTSRVAHGGLESFIGFTGYHQGKSIIRAGPSLKNTGLALVTGGQSTVVIVQKIDGALRLGLSREADALNQRLLDRFPATAAVELRLVRALSSDHRVSS